MMLAISAILLLFVALLAAYRFGENGAERFWIWLASVVLQIGGMALALSCVNQLAPAPWIALHAVIALAGAWLSKDALPAFKSWIFHPRSPLEFLRSLNGIERAFVFLIALCAICAFTQQWTTPIFEGD